MKHSFVLFLMSLVSLSPLVRNAEASFEHCRGVVRLSKSMSEELSRDELEMISSAFAKKRFVLRLAKEKSDLNGLATLHEFQLRLGNEQLGDGYESGYGAGSYETGGLGASPGYSGYNSGSGYGSSGGYGSGYVAPLGAEPVLSLVWNVPGFAYATRILTPVIFQTSEPHQLTRLGWWFAQVIDRYIPNCEDVVSGRASYEVKSGTTSLDRKL